MKKTNFKILIGAILIFLILNVLPSLSKAASFKPTISSTSVNVGDTITLTLKADNAAGIYKVNTSNSNVSLISGSESEFLENTTTTLKYKANKAGTVTITATASDMSDLDDSSKKVTGTQNFTVTIKEKTTSSSNTGGSNSSGNTTTPKTPTFKSVNQKIYTKGDCNLRSSWSTSSTATPVKKGTELTLTGTSTETINGYTWYRVNYQGGTKYIASSLITYTKPDDSEKTDKKDEDKDEGNQKEKSSNKNLSSLKIEGIEIKPAFEKDITQYTAQVESDVTELKIDAKAEQSKAKITIEGNKNLKEGDNIIKIKVTAEDETTRTYFITVTQGEGTSVDTGLKLSELKIERVNFEETFKPDVHSYELDLTSYVKKLEITATPSQADATVEITGNEEFKAGQNVIIILLTSADGKETANYQIKVNVPAEAIEKAEEPDTTLYILIGVAIAVVLIAIVLIIRHHRASRDDYGDDEEDSEEEKVGRRFSNYEDNYQEDRNNDYQERETRRAKKSDVTLDDFLNLPDDDDDMPRGQRGRHSR